MKSIRGLALTGSLLVSGACSVVGFPAGGPGDAPGPVVERERPATVSPRDARDPIPTYEPIGRRGNASSYEVWGEVYEVSSTSDGYDEEGYASWYGESFRGKPTSNGEIYNPDLLTAAHRSLPLPTWVEVTNLSNGLKVIVRVNDRGPFADTERRILDLSRAAAERIDLIGPGVAQVRIRALRRDELSGGYPDALRVP